MKRSTVIRILALAVALLILGVSCYWTPQDEENVEGSLSLDMSGIATQADVTGDTARVYLLAEKGKAQGLYPLGDGEDYVDVDVDDTLTIDGIAPGFSYRVLISFGTDRGSWFEVTEYAESDPVEVESGSQAEVTVSVVDATQFLTYPSSGAAGLNGKELNGVVFSTSVYAADSDRVYDIATGLESANTTNITPVINSVSRGDATNPVLVNTQGGIYAPTNSPLSGDYIDPVTLSTAFDGRVILQGPGIIAAADAIGAAADDWAVVDLGDTIAGDPIRDYAVSGTNAAVVSALGSFTSNSTEFSGLNDGSTWDDISDLVTFLDQDIPARILSVGYGEATLFAPGTSLYVGTDDGVYEYDTNDSGNTGGPLFQSSNTIISKIASNSDGDVAFLGPYYLFIYDESESSVSRFPFVAGFPGNPTDMTWDDNDPGSLYITGKEGIVRIGTPTP
ncbi:MAG: hypothetical protein GVY14_09675 [Spirochaetes bacterium]|jgi:hypothetical protein|nr:hypothetical protein [Spirochaetota bacterium]